MNSFEKIGLIVLFFISLIYSYVKPTAIVENIQTKQNIIIYVEGEFEQKLSFKTKPTINDVLTKLQTDNHYQFNENYQLTNESKLYLPHGQNLMSLNHASLDDLMTLKGIGEKTAIPDKLQEAAETLAQQGKTPLLFMSEAKLAGIIAVADTIKADSPEAISELRNMGIRVIMLTGDNERTARAIGDQAGVDEVIAGVLPGGKEDVIRSLKKYGKTAMVGDGINDAPALTRADVGIAIGAGADVAVDAADVVLMKNTLADVPAAIRLSRGVLKNIHENLFWAFFYNAIGIPLAAGCFAALGLTLNPMFGAAAMSLSSFCVVMNALRLNLYKIYDAGHDKKRRHSSEISETGAGDVCTMKIKGMMCTHCEATVRNALEALGEVKSAEVSHEDGVAVVELAGAADSKKLKKAVETAGYKVISIK